MRREGPASGIFEECGPISEADPLSARDFALSLESVAPWPEVSLPEDVEAKLIERLIARDERAFNELVTAYGRRVSALRPSPPGSISLASRPDGPSAACR